MLISLHDNYQRRIAHIDNALPKAMHYNDDKWNRNLAYGTGIFEFTIDRQDLEIESQLVVGNYISFRYNNRDYMFTILRSEKSSDDKKIIVHSEYLSLGLLKSTQDSLDPSQTHTLEWYLTQSGILVNSGIKLGINEVSGLARKIKIDGEQTSLQRLTSFATNFGAEIEYVTTLNRDGTLKSLVVNFYKKFDGVNQGVGTNRQDLTLSYGKNVSGIKQTTDITDFFSMITPTGKDGLTITSLDRTEYDENGKILFFTHPGQSSIYAPQSAQRFPSRLIRTNNDYTNHKYSADGTSDQNTLYTLALNELKKHCDPSIIYDVTGFYDLNIGDTVKIFDASFNPPLMLQARVAEQTISFSNPSNNKTIFGNIIALESQASQDLASRLKELVDQATPYRFEIVSDNGLTFKNSTGSTTLTARVYKGSNIDEVSVDSFEWLIDGISFGGTAKSQLVDTSQVTGTAVVRYNATIGGVVIGGLEVTLQDVSDGTNGISPTVKINPDTSLTIVDAQGTSTTPPLKGTGGKTYYTHTAYANKSKDIFYDLLPSFANSPGYQGAVVSSVPENGAYKITTTGGTHVIKTHVSINGTSGKALWSIVRLKNTHPTNNLILVFNGIGDGKVLNNNFPSIIIKPGEDYFFMKSGIARNSYDYFQIILRSDYADKDLAFNLYEASFYNSYPFVNFSFVPNNHGYLGNYTDALVSASTDITKYNWSLIRGNDGIAGKDGVGIKTTVITYAISTSGTTAPSTGWTSTVPSLVKGQYLWTKTVWTYTDNSSETGYSVTYISKDGNNGTDGIAGKDGVGIKTTTITYAGSTSGTTAPTSGWTSTIPAVASGSYLWTKYVWTYTDNTSETGYSVAKMGDTGPKGDTGATGAKGETGSKGDAGPNGQDAITVVLSNENVTLPANPLGAVTSYNGSSTTLSVFVGQQPLPYGTGANKWTVSWSASGATRASGTNDGIVCSFANISGMSSDSGATATQTFVLSINIGGVTSTVTKVQNISKAEKGITGDDGVDSFTYFRYSPYTDGRNMTSLPNADSKYIGLCVTTSATAPSSNSSYTWSKYAGNDANKYGDNVIFNPKFENIQIGKVNPGDMINLGWDVNNPSYLLQPESDAPSEKIIHLNINDTYLLSKGIPVTPGERYIFSLDIKTTNFGSGNTAPLAFRMYPSSNDGNSLSSTGHISEVLVRINGQSSGSNLIDVSNFSIVNNANWNTRSYVFEIPENVAYIRPILYHRGGTDDKTKYRKLELRKQQQSAVIKSATEPKYKYVGMQWQYTGTSTITIGGIAIQPSTIYIWSGSVWQMYVMRSTNLQVDNGFISNAMIANATIESAKIKSLDAKKINADNISVISLNLGDMTGGTVKLMADVDVNGTLKKHGIYQSKMGLLSSGPSLATPSTLSNSQMGVANLNKGELRFIVTDYTEDLKNVQETGMSDPNTAFIQFNSYDNGKDVMLIGSSGEIVFKGITSQDTPWIAMGNGAYYKNMFSRVYISYSVTATSTANIPLGVLPVGLRPFRGLHLTANAWGTTLSNDRHVEVRTTGEVTLYNPVNGASYDGEVSFTL